MVRQSLREYLEQRRPRRVLLVSPDPASRALFPEGSVVYRASPFGRGGAGDIVCAQGRLPFQSRIFDLVLAEHVLCDGAEPGLGEMERVLEGGGQLVVLGLGYWGVRYRFSGWHGRRAAIRPMRLCQVLRRRDFTIEDCMGNGLAGVQVATGEAWKKPLVGVSDEVMIRARSRGQTRIVTPLTFGRARAVGARSAALDGLSREAVS